MKIAFVRFKKFYRWCASVLYESSFLVFPSSCLLCGMADQVLCYRCFALSKYHYSVRSVEGACEILLKGDGSPKIEVLAGARYSHEAEDSAKRHAVMISHYKKYGDVILKRYLAEVLAKNLEMVLDGIKGQNNGKCGVSEKIFLIPVPGSTKSFIKRGFSPVLEIVKSVYFERKCRSFRGKYGTAPEVRNVLKLGFKSSVLHTAQKNLPARQRAHKQSGSMRLNFLGRRMLRREWSSDEKIHCIIVDDVLTTGATLNEAHRALKQGVEAVHGQRGSRRWLDEKDPGSERPPSNTIGCRNAIVLASTKY